MLTEREISNLYERVQKAGKPRKTPQAFNVEYSRAMHEKHKEKRNKARLEYYHRHKVDKSKLNLGLL